MEEENKNEQELGEIDTTEETAVAFDLYDEDEELGTDDEEYHKPINHDDGTDEDPDAVEIEIYEEESF
jgi:hypothetical protein